MVIVALSGKRGTGKSTLANYMVKNCGFTKISFAEELKRLSKTLLPFSEGDLTSPKLKEAKWKGKDFSPREFMIHFGEFMRFHDEDYWVRIAMEKCSKKDGFYVFDDVRFLNEMNLLASINKIDGNKCVSVRINRYEKENVYGKNLDIPSETQLDDYEFDYVVTEPRNVSLKDLYAHSDRILELI